MKYLIILLSSAFVLFNSCKKNNKLDRACFSDTNNAGHITDKQALISKSGNKEDPTVCCTEILLITKITR